jgi:DNA end-binding protein Ku
MIELAQHIIDKKEAKFDPSKFDDKYEDALLELIRAKKAGKKAPKAKAAARPSNVVNLFDALKKSLAADNDAGEVASVKAARASKKKTHEPKPSPKRKKSA